MELLKKIQKQQSFFPLLFNKIGAWFEDSIYFVDFRKVMCSQFQLLVLIPKARIPLNISARIWLQVIRVHMVVSRCHEGLQRSCSHNWYIAFCPHFVLLGCSLWMLQLIEYVLDPQDYSMQPPNQELIVRDLQDNLWTFRHIYRGRVKHYSTCFCLVHGYIMVGVLGPFLLEVSSFAAPCRTAKATSSNNWMEPLCWGEKA